MQTVHVDNCQLEESFDTAQEFCLIIAVDRYTRFTWAIPTRKDPTCQECLDKLDDYIWMSFGYPATIVSDNAQDLNSTHILRRIMWRQNIPRHTIRKEMDQWREQTEQSSRDSELNNLMGDDFRSLSSR